MDDADSSDADQSNPYHKRNRFIYRHNLRFIIRLQQAMSFCVSFADHR